jgi:hypothetical protein
MRARTVPFDRRMDFVLPRSLFEAVGMAAAARMQSRNSWLRLAILEQLRRERDVRVENARSIRSQAS